MKFKTLFFALTLAFLLVSSVFSQDPKPEPTYEQLVAKVKSGDSSVDFKALRLAFTKTENYSPYGGDRDARKAMSEALNKKEYKDALKKADAILNSEFVNMDAHVIASLASEALGDKARAETEKKVYLGLVNSILTGADGKSEQTAYVVISTEEEYIVLRALGLRPAGQALRHDGGHTFDVLTGADPETKQSKEIFFNIDIVWKAETDMFNPKKN